MGPRTKHVLNKKYKFQYFTATFNLTIFHTVINKTTCKRFLYSFGQPAILHYRPSSWSTSWQVLGLWSQFCWTHRGSRVTGTIQKRGQLYDQIRCGGWFLGIFFVKFHSLHVFYFPRLWFTKYVCFFFLKLFFYDVFGFWRALSIEEVAHVSSVPSTKSTVTKFLHTYISPPWKTWRKNGFVFISCLTWR